MDRRFIALALAFVAVDASATRLNKCVDESGHVTFTQTACPGGLSGESINVLKGGAGMSLGPSGEVTDSELAAESESGGTKFTIVGGDSVSDCGTSSDQEIRAAIVRNQVFEGMTGKQAIQSWGSPDVINRSSSGRDQWVYYRDEVLAQYVYVDKKGCVTGWN
jgi:hypothetical protein